MRLSVIVEGSNQIAARDQKAADYQNTGDKQKKTTREKKHLRYVAIGTKIG